MPYRKKIYEFIKPKGLNKSEGRYPVIIVGAGPVGVSTALELANYGVPSVILEKNNSSSDGSKAICWSKRSLEIFDRFGLGEKLLQKGITWKIGRTFHKDLELFNFDLLPEEGHKFPAFINLQQYYVEEYLIEKALAHDLIDIRFCNSVETLQNKTEYVELAIQTPEGEYTLEAEYVIACDGVRSKIRKLLGLDFIGELFEERFLIADIEMKKEFPSERWFWFDPLFHQGQSALLHKQPDQIYRIDLQLGWGVDPEEEKQPKKVIPRIKKVVGHSDFTIDWISIYAFQCRRLEKFIHNRIIFAGDSAHVVSPFGARGGNGGMQDVDNLCWKLASLIQGKASINLLYSYEKERVFGADDNIAHSTRTTKFMTPAEGIEQRFRDQLFKLAKYNPFVRGWINSGRLSQPTYYPWFEDDGQNLPKVSKPGKVMPDALLNTGDWLIDLVGGEIVVMGINCALPSFNGAKTITIDPNALIKERFLGSNPKAIYLFRPDQVIQNRWNNLDKTIIQKSIDKILKT